MAYQLRYNNGRKTAEKTFIVEDRLVEFLRGMRFEQVKAVYRNRQKMEPEAVRALWNQANRAEPVGQSDR